MVDPTRRAVIPLRVQIYAATIIVATVALLPLSKLAGGAVGGWRAALDAAILTALIAGAHRHPIRIGMKRRINVSAAPDVAAVLLLPGPLAVIAVVCGAFLGTGLRPGRVIQRAFNTSIAGLRALAGVLVYAGVLQAGTAAYTEPLADAVALVAMYLATTLPVIGIAAIQLRENPMRRMWVVPRDTLAAETALGVTGLLAAVAARQEAWALPLLAAPATLAYYALRDSVALRAQTRLALEDLADIVDMRDHYTFEHSRRVAELARATARRLGLSPAEVDLITMAGRVHDVGKIGIKSSVLMKPDRLTEPEWAEMRSHPVVGARLIANFPQFAGGRDLVLHHHERFDGQGYPRGLAGEAIPFGARVLAVADAWDAMTSHRAYRKALDVSRVFDELERCRGKQFDPRVLDAFLAVVAERPDLMGPHTEPRQAADALLVAAANA